MPPKCRFDDMCRMSTMKFFIACLLAVCIRADESACDCTSETDKAAALSSQVQKLEGELKESKSSSKQFEEKLDALKSSSQKSEADLEKKAKELAASQKKVQDLEESQASAQQKEASLQKKVQELEASQASSQKKVKELEGSHASSGKQAETEINGLKAKVKDLIEQLESAQKSKEDALQECSEISMLGFASKVGSMTNGVVKHALESTDFDEKLATQVHAHVGTATGAAGKMASSFKDRIASVNYTDVMERLSSSQAYQKVTDTVAEKTQSLMPHIEKARVTLEPHVTKAKDMAGPAWAKAQPTLEKAKTKALETYDAGATAVQTHVLPVLKRGGSSALNQISELALAQLERVMTPTFDAIGKAVPEHASTLPTHAVDRALFLLVGVVLAYYSLYFVRVALRITLRLTARTSLMSLSLFKLIVMIPLKLLSYLIDFAWWVVTLFYCCGLCRRKKKAAKLAAKGKKEEKKTAASGSADKAETVTAAECQALFEMSKEKNKVDEGARQLAKYVKEKKPMKASSVQGKILTKEVFLQTCKKFNVNTKKLDL